jgi:hypothetical protein
MEIEGPDGVRIQFPEGTSQEVILRVMRERYGGPSAVDAPSPMQGDPMADPMAAQGGPAPAVEDQPQSDMPPGMVLNPQTGQYIDTMAQAERNSLRDGLTGQEVAAQTLRGLPYIGRGFDEALGSADEAMGGVPGLRKEQLRSMVAVADRDRPGASMAANLTGSVLGTIPLMVAGAASLPATGASMLTRTAVGAGAGAVLGGTEGATSGALGAREGERVQGAVKGGVIGTGLGTVLGAAAPVVAEVAKPVVKRLMSKASAIAKSLGISREAADILSTGLEGDARGRALIRVAGDDGMLADAGPGAVQMLDTAIQSGGGASAKTAVSKRAAMANSRMTAALDSTLGKPAGVKELARGIADSTRPARQAAYDAAYALPIDYAAAAGRNIEAVMDRIPQRTVQAAVAEANDIMREAGIKNKQIIATIAPDGSVSFATMPDVLQLDMLKRGLGAVAEKEVDALGRATAAGVRATRLARDLRDAVSDAVPGYRTAVNLGGDKIAQDQALTLGRKMLSDGVTREEVADAVRGATVAERKAMGEGLRSQIDEAMANVKAALTNRNMDAREAAKAFKGLSSRAAYQKMNLLLGEAKARTLYREINRAGDSLGLAANVVGNSATFARRQMDDRVNEALKPGVVGTAMAGEPLEASKRAIQWFTGRTPEALMAKKEGVYSEISKVLTGPRGRDAEKLLVELLKLKDSSQITEAQAREIALSIGIGSTAGADQAAMQRLQQN